MRIQLSDNFYLDEFTFSDTAIRNGIEIVVEQGAIQFDRLERFAQTIAQPLRNEAGRINVLSGYRPLAVNRLVGSNDDSQHIKCLAGDLDAEDEAVTPYDLCKLVIKLKLPFDQLIHEFGRWAHISISKASRVPRGQILTSYRAKPIIGKQHTAYVSGLVTMESLWSRANGSS